MKPRIAFYTFGVLREPVGNPVVQGFIDRVASVYAAAEGSEGFFERSVRNVQTWEHSWGPITTPQCMPSGVDHAQLAMTISLWRDLESVAAFAYRGAHGEALSRRREWFAGGAYPGYVAWWVDEQHRPNFSEAADRLDLLHTQGATPAAFTFRQAFDPAGAPVRLKAARAEP